MLMNCSDFDFDLFYKIKNQKRGRGNPSNSKGIKYKDCISAFDIETSGIKEIEQSFMYVWQWHFLELDCTVFGRTWQEFEVFARALIFHMKDKEYLCVFVHNLSYEFQFLRGIYNFEPEEVFAIQSRKVLKCTMFNHLEFRCSYLHSNMSLKLYTEKMNIEHKKLDGDEFNYNIVRYPWDELTERETEYCANDVIGLCEAIRVEMSHDGDNLYTFPLTSTGYVRRDAKRAMRKISHTFVKEQLPDIDLYKMLREAFRGGNTHANRAYAGIVLHGVKSYDRSSSYPDTQCNCMFPVGRFFHAGECSKDEILNLINIRKKAVIMRVAFWNVRLKYPWWGCPYLSRDKCRNIQGGTFDNGRILEAEYIETTITDIDLRIILDEYEFDNSTFFDVYHARYGKLPKPLIEITIDYYRKKTELKDVAGQELLYLKSKNKLNSIYGMMAQDPVKQSIDFRLNPETGIRDFMERDENWNEILEKSNKRAFLCYQWGVWVTAWARYRLEEGIKLAGDGFVYCDTDSVKYLGSVDWESYNKKRIADSKKSGSFATDPKGVTHYMGVYEYEGEYFEFSTLGAKKYCYRKTNESKLSVTISGVTKSKGGIELEKAGGISAFKEGFTFHEAGGTESVYNDNPEIVSYSVDGHSIPITANVFIRESTYTLGITAEYARLLEDSRKYFKEWL